MKQEEVEDLILVKPLKDKFASAIIMAIIYGLIWLLFFLTMVVVIRKARDMIIILMLIFLQLASLSNMGSFIYNLTWHGYFTQD